MGAPEYLLLISNILISFTSVPVLTNYFNEFTTIYLSQSNTYDKNARESNFPRFELDNEITVRDYVVAARNDLCYVISSSKTYHDKILTVR